MPIKGFERVEDQSVEAVEEMYGYWSNRKKKMVIHWNGMIPYVCDYSGVEYEIKWSLVRHKLNIKHRASSKDRLNFNDLYLYYRKIKDLDKVCQKYKTSVSTIKAIFKQRGVDLSDRDSMWLFKIDQKDLIKDYLDEKGVSCLMDKYNLALRSIKKVLKINGIEPKFKDSKFKREFFPNDSFFKSINNESSAYVLGLLLADGYVDQESFSISLQEGDLNILKKIQGVIYENRENPNIGLRDFSHKENSQNQYRLYVYSPVMAKDLDRLGCHQKKSFTAYIEDIFIKENMYKHIIRGFFDGDGCIHKSSRDGQYKILFTTSSERLAIQINDCLRKNEIVSNIYNKQRESMTYSVEVSELKSIHNLFKFLYEDSSLFMERKFVKFVEFLVDRESFTLEKTKKQRDGKFNHVRERKDGKFTVLFHKYPHKVLNKSYKLVFENKEDCAVEANKIIDDLFERKHLHFYNWVNYEELEHLISAKRILGEININKKAISELPEIAELINS